MEKKMTIYDMKIIMKFEYGGWVARIFNKEKEVFVSNPNFTIGGAIEIAQSAIIMRLTGYV